MKNRKAMRRLAVLGILAIVAFARCGDDESCNGVVIVGEVCPGTGDPNAADGSVGIDGKSDAHDSSPNHDVIFTGACEGKFGGDDCDGDENACTHEACDPTTGKCTIKGTIVCNDKFCEQGICNQDTGLCDYTPAPIGTKCTQSCFTNSYVCDGASSCVPGDYVCADGANDCEIVPVTAKKIDCSGKKPTDQCAANYDCDATTGECTRLIYRAEGSPCDLDNDVCTLDACLPTADNPNVSVCTKTDGLDTCEDQTKNNPCWTYACVGKAGCKQTGFVADVPCNDGNACTVNDTCIDGGSGFGQQQCKGTALPSDDGNVCTNDTCENGEVKHHPLTGVPCEDNFLCTTTSCLDGKCKPTGQISCDDGNVCTYDLCDPQSGCVSIPNNEPCEDGSVCTNKDTCNQKQCKGVPIICEDENPCNGRQICVESQGCVEAEPAPICDDGNLCTDDICNPQFKTSELDKLADACGHAFNTQPCDDNTACSLFDICSAGECKGQGIKCDDNDLCNGTFGCDKEIGCVKLSDTVSCDDKNACTDDFCDPQSGCVFVPNNTPCNDGNACTKDDACKLGACKGTDVKCDNANVCDGLESCDAAVGCKAGAPLVCDDNDKCSGEESCHQIVGCLPGSPLVCDDDTVCNGSFTCKAAIGCVQVQQAPNCDDKNACTDDFCDPKLGCQHTNNVSPCDDNNKCTIGDKCKAGVCTPANNVVCFDDNVCTTDVCNPNTGVCSSTPQKDAACNDGDDCTLVDACTAAGNCVGSGVKKCPSDNDPCTADICVSFYGCDYPKLTCDDGEECTYDYCGTGAGGGGCFHVNKDNGNVCGANKTGTCQTGKCVTP